MKVQLKRKQAAEKEYVLKLYVTGATRRSQTAITNLKTICDQYLAGHYDLEVVDIYQSPLLAKKAEILAAPTLVKQLPLPARRLIGDLSEQGKLLMLLNLKPKKGTND
jgi:circadian clock protein KaiB